MRGAYGWTLRLELAPTFKKRQASPALRAKQSLPNLRAVPSRALEIARVDADKCSAVSANVVFIGAELATLSRDALQLLLGRSVGISNLHDETFITQKPAHRYTCE